MSSDIQKSVILVGGGHTHALVLNALKENPLQVAHITVINPGKTAPYSGMLPGYVAGHYKRAELDIDLQQLSQDVGATLIDSKAVSIDTTKKLVHLENGHTLSYHLASVDVGITSHMNDLPGFTEHGVPAKPLANFAHKWEDFRNAAGTKHVAVIGGGIAGAELSMAMAFALRADKHDASVDLLDRSYILSNSSNKTQKCIREKLKANNVSVYEHANVIQVTATGVDLADGSSIAANFVVGAAGATPHAWIKTTGLNLYKGFIIVNEYLQTSVPDVFAVGDCAHMEFDPRPKAGVYAVRQAPILLNNIRMALSDAPLTNYAPQSDYLKLVSLGDQQAFGEKMGCGMSGRIVWRLKNHIDKSFMNQF